MSISQLVAAARQGDLNAYNRIVLDYQDQTYTFAYRVLGDENAAAGATQEAFIQAYQELRRRRTVPFRFHLLATLVAICRKKFNRNARQEQVTAGSGTLQRPERGFYFECLPLEQSLAVALVDLEGLDYEQAAQIMGTATSLVRQHLAQARHSLMKQVPNSPLKQQAPQ